MERCGTLSVRDQARLGAVLVLATSMPFSPLQGQLSGSGPPAAPPSGLRVAGGAALGGVIAAGVVGGVSLVAAGGNTDCFEAGCAALLLAGAAWPLGAAVGASRAISSQGSRVGAGTTAIFSILGLGAGAAAMLAVDGLDNPPDLLYAAAGIGADLLTMSFLARFASSTDSTEARLAIHPVFTAHGAGLAAALPLR